MPQTELRALFDRLQLEVAYHPAESVLDVSITLYGEEASSLPGGESSEDCLVPPVGPGSVLRRFRRLIRRICLAVIPTSTTWDACLE